MGQGGIEGMVWAPCMVKAAERVGSCPEDLQWGGDGHEMAMGRRVLCQRDGQSKLSLCPVCVLQLKRGPACVGFVTD